TLIFQVTTVLLPQSSVSVHSRTIVYEPAQVPGVSTIISLNETVTAPQSSVYSMLASSTAGMELQSTVTSSGEEITSGAWVSLNVTLAEACAVLPQPSVAV